MLWVVELFVIIKNRNHSLLMLRHLSPLKFFLLLLFLDLRRHSVGKERGPHVRRNDESDKVSNLFIFFYFEESVLELDVVHLFIGVSRNFLSELAQGECF